MPRNLNFLFRCFVTLVSVFIGRLNKKSLILCLNDLRKWKKKCSKTSAQKSRRRGIAQEKDRIQHSQHGKSLKSRVSNGVSLYTRVYFGGENGAFDYNIIAKLSSCICRIFSSSKNAITSIKPSFLRVPQKQ